MEYATNLDYLFNYTTPSNDKPYNVDLLLYNYSDTAASFSTNLPLNGKYFVSLNSISLKYEDAESVNLWSSEVSFDKERTNRKFESKSSTASGTCPTLTGSSSSISSTMSSSLDSSTVFLGDIDKNDINVSLGVDTTLSSTNATKKEIANFIDTRIRSLSKNLMNKPIYKNKELNTLFSNVSHTEFDTYLSEINTAIGVVYLKKAYSKLVETQTQQTSVPSGISDADRFAVEEGDRIRLSAITNLRVINVGWKLEPLLDDLRIASKVTLYSIITKLPSYSASTFIKGFASRDNMTPTGTSKGYYYLYRTLMYDYFRIDKKVFYEDDAKIDLFARKLIIDLFIKCCYPLIHYDLIDVLMKHYTNVGDFVNARFALLAKCIFTYNIVNELVTSMDTADVSEVIKVEFTTHLTSYIKKNNSGDFHSDKSTDQKIKDIVIELHKLSNKVISTSDTTDLLSDAIEKNQLSMRNIVDAIEGRKKAVQMKYLEFYILVGVIVLVIVTCGVLYFLEIYDIGLIIAASIVVLVLAYKLILLIISFVTKN